jgi:hypothetical protein
VARRFNLAPKSIYIGGLSRMLSFPIPKVTTQTPTVLPITKFPKIYSDKFHFSPGITDGIKTAVFKNSGFNAIRDFYSQQVGPTLYYKGHLSPQVFLEAKKRNPGIQLVIDQYTQREFPVVPTKKHADDLIFCLKMSHQSSSDIFHNHWDKLFFAKQLTLQQESDGLQLESHGNDPIILFPRINFPEQSNLTLYVDISVSNRSLLQIFYSSKENSKPFFDQKRSTLALLKPGRNFVKVSLPETMGHHLRLDPSMKPGKIEIHNLKITIEHDPL